MKIMTDNDNNKSSVIPRYPELQKIIRREKTPVNFRRPNEVEAAVRMGKKPHQNNQSFRDIYEFYQNNEY